MASKIWKSANGTKYTVSTEWAPYDCLYWTARYLSGERICGGIIDKPQTAKAREDFVSEIKAAVNYSLQPYGDPI